MLSDILLQYVTAHLKTPGVLPLLAILWIVTYASSLSHSPSSMFLYVGSAFSKSANTAQTPDSSQIKWQTSLSMSSAINSFSGYECPHCVGLPDSIMNFCAAL